VRGTATINFGAAPGGNTASVVITGQSSILSTSHVGAFMMYDSTADHNAEEHAMVPILLTGGSIVVATGFTIFARSEWRLTGQFSVRWVYS
jgi:hypothetical protein